MYKSTKLKESIINELKTRYPDLSISEAIEKLLSLSVAEELTAPTYDLEIDELPACCQRIYQDEIPRKRNLCSHWKLAYQNRWGAKVLNYQHSITGRFCDDPIYVENYA